MKMSFVLFGKQSQLVMVFGKSRNIGKDFNKMVIVLNWDKFTSFIKARERYKKISCIYIQTDSKGNPIRVGKASKGLEVRYRGGTGYALEAAMHESGNQIFISKVNERICEDVENNLIFQHRKQLKYNNIGKKNRLANLIKIIHKGKKPKLIVRNNDH